MEMQILIDAWADADCAPHDSCASRCVYTSQSLQADGASLSIYDFGEYHSAADPGC